MLKNKQENLLAFVYTALPLLLMIPLITLFHSEISPEWFHCLTFSFVCTYYFPCHSFLFPLLHILYLRQMWNLLMRKRFSFSSGISTQVSQGLRMMMHLAGIIHHSILISSLTLSCILCSLTFLLLLSAWVWVQFANGLLSWNWREKE